jgi:hypothetical protein
MHLEMGNFLRRACVCQSMSFRRLAFWFTGMLDKLTLMIDRPKPLPEDEKR